MTDQNKKPKENQTGNAVPFFNKDSKDVQEKVQPPVEIVEDGQNVVISVKFLQSIYDYLDSRPRREVDELCMGLIKAPTFGEFKKMVEKHYTKD